MNYKLRSQLVEVAKETPQGCLNCRHYELDEGCRSHEAAAQGKPRFNSCAYLWRRNFR